MPAPTSTDIIAHCTSTAIELQYHVDRYEEQLEAYQETGEPPSELEDTIEDVGEAWKTVDEYKEQLDQLIAELEIEVDNGAAQWYVESVEGLLHTTMTVDDAVEAAEMDDHDGYDDLEDDIAAAAIYTDYDDLAAFNRRYVESLASIARHEQDIREDPDLPRSPEQVRMEDDEDYITFEERIRQQIEILEQAKEQF